MPLSLPSPARTLPWLMLAGLIACGGKKEEDQRSSADQHIGKGLFAGYQFDAAEGLLHTRETTDHSLRLRANGQEFALSFVRHDEKSSSQALELIIENLPAALRLTADQAVFSGDDPYAQTGEDFSTQHPLSYRWQLNIPAATERFTLTAPLQARSAFSFLAMGDIQDGIDDFGDVVARINQEQGVDFLLFLGDLTMRSEPKEFSKVLAAWRTIKIPVFSTPGNHDVNDNERYQQLLGRGNYSFTHKGARFTSVDSASWTLSQEAWHWYRNWLAAGQAQPHILFSHIAPTEPLGFRGGHWRSRREANYFVALASRYQADAMLFGHLHTLDSYRLAGIPTYISGGGGAFEEKLDGIKRHLLRVHVPAENSTAANSPVEVGVVRVDP